MLKPAYSYQDFSGFVYFFPCLAGSPLFGAGARSIASLRFGRVCFLLSFLFSVVWVENDPLRDTPRVVSDIFPSPARYAVKLHGHTSSSMHMTAFFRAFFFSCLPPSITT